MEMTKKELYDYLATVKDDAEIFIDTSGDGSDVNVLDNIDIRYCPVNGSMTVTLFSDFPHEDD
jgi:hypothetical protein